MKKIFLLFFIFIVFHWHFSYSLFIYEDCHNWIYKDYYSSNANICWYYDWDLRVYPWKTVDYYDEWFWTIWKERLLKASESSISLNNIDSSAYNLTYWTAQFSSNWVSSEADQSSYAWKKPIIWWLYDVWLNVNQDISKLDRNKPVARIDWNIVNYITDSNGDIQPPITDWKYCTVDISTTNWQTIISSCNYVNNTWIKKTRSNLKWQHVESYVILPAWCWDNVIDSWEQCDDGNNNNNDGCNSTCHTEWWAWGWWGWWGWYCWDWIKNWIEQCDDGNNNNDDGCSSTCHTEWWAWCVWFPCTNWACWSLNWQTINSSDTSKIQYFKDPSVNHDKFCSSTDDVLSYSYNPNIDNKSFHWKCWLQSCSANIRFDTWVIKIYGSYSWAVFACSECNGFDYEWPIKFNSDYDTTYTKSIMLWDYLPFGWILSNYQHDYVTNCDSVNVWKYNKNNVRVKFKVWSLSSSEYAWFAWPTLHAFPWDTSVIWQWYISSNQTHNFKYWLNTINWYITYRQICNSYIVTFACWKDKKWNTIYCDNTYYKWEDDVTSPLLFSQTNFTMTNHYMIQKWTPITNVSNVDLKFNWKTLSNYWIQSPNIISDYDKNDLSKVLTNFIWKYKKYAKINWITLFKNQIQTFKKVITQEIYYIDLDSWNLTIWWDTNISKPTTLIVENGDVTIDWEIFWPFMLVVKNGKIKIQNSKMNIQSKLDWYYITDKWFEITWPASTNSNILNDDPSSSRWYADGRLLINWVLIWPNADQIYKKRRSVLKNWFRYWSNYAIWNGWSLTITTNQNLWTNPPVGSKDLFEVLKVLKWK